MAAGGAARAQSSAPAPNLHVAAAADLTPVLPVLAAEYEKATGVHLTPTFGSSATLTEQIANGSPSDLFLSADCAHPQQLVDAHLATGLPNAPGSSGPVLYARGVLVLWARHDSPAQPLSLESLKKPAVAHVAVANDRHAPYGQAATAAIQALHLEAPLAGKLVVGENIAQTAQFADTGNAQAALISLTIASSPHFRETGSFVRLPAVYPPIRQCGVALTHPGALADQAQRFLTWLTSPAVQARLSQFGLEQVKP